MFTGTIWSLLPPILAIMLALITKEVYSSLFVGIVVGSFMYAQFHPWTAFTVIFDTIKDSMNINILFFLVMLGMIVVLMSRSGGSAAYGKWAISKIKNKKVALLATMGLGVLIFVDDYFNCLTVGSVMRPVTDRYKVSRAKLAYIIDATAAPVCIIAPISSWAAAVNSYVPKGSSLTGFSLFLRTIPYNLYAILTLLMVFYLILTGFDFGLMKKHEINAERGDLFTSGEDALKEEKQEEVNEKGRVADLVLPVVLLIVMFVASALGGMIWGMIPAVFKANWNTNETLFTLMLNYVAMQVVTYCIVFWENPKGSNTVGIINQATKAGWLPELFGQKYGWNVVIVLILTVGMFIYLKYCKQGYEIAVVGESENTARYAGIQVKKVIIRTMAISGAICGIAGFVIVSGASHTISTATAGGRGFTAIIVAWLSKFNTFIMVAVSFGIVFMNQGAVQIATQYGLNENASDVILGIILFFLIGAEFFINYRVKRAKK